MAPPVGRADTPAMSLAQDPARPRPRLAIVDADPRVRASLASLISSDGRIEVVGAAGHVGAALDALDADPDVVVVDPRLPDVDSGLALLREMSLRRPGCRVVILSWPDPVGDGSLPAGADLFVAKSAAPADLIEAILAAAPGPEEPSTPASPPRRPHERPGTAERVG